LHNIAKHAKATQVNISIEQDLDKIKVCVKDNGAGFEPSKISAAKGGFGLFNIRERLEHIGGSLLIDSKIGQGSQIVIIAPLEADNLEIGQAEQN
jgi:signal transduction histidine kinase